MASIAIQNVMDALLEKFGDADGNISIPQDELAKALKTMKTTGRVRKTRTMRDPDAPKRPTSAYMLWATRTARLLRTITFRRTTTASTATRMITTMAKST